MAATHALEELRGQPSCPASEIEDALAADRGETMKDPPAPALLRVRQAVISFGGPVHRARSSAGQCTVLSPRAVVRTVVSHEEPACAPPSSCSPSSSDGRYSPGSRRRERAVGLCSKTPPGPKRNACWRRTRLS